MSPRVGSRSRNAEFAKWMFGAKMHVFANSAAERASAGPKAAAEAGLLGVVQLSRVVERCHNVPLRRGMDCQLVATTPRADTTGSRALSSAWRQARDEKVIAREDGYTYIAALRSPDLRHTTTRKREGDTSVTVVQPIPADMRLLQVFSIGIPYFLLPNLDSVNHCTSKEISMVCQCRRQNLLLPSP